MPGSTLAMCAAALAALVACGALAADADGDFAIKGAGAQTCGRFIAAWDAASPDLAQYGGWIAGYVTGLNQHLDDTYDLQPWQTTETMLGLMKAYCDRQPEDTAFMRAVTQVISALSPQRLLSASPLEGVRRGETAVVVYREVVRLAQTRLAQLGHDPGTTDGTFDQATSDALIAFQRAEALEQTGLPDQPTLFRLFVGGQIRR